MVKEIPVFCLPVYSTSKALRVPGKPDRHRNPLRLLSGRSSQNDQASCGRPRRSSARTETPLCSNQLLSHIRWRALPSARRAAADQQRRRAPGSRLSVEISVLRLPQASCWSACFSFLALMTSGRRTRRRISGAKFGTPSKLRFSPSVRVSPMRSVTTKNTPNAKHAGVLVT